MFDSSLVIKKLLLYNFPPLFASTHQHHSHSANQPDNHPTRDKDDGEHVEEEEGVSVLSLAPLLISQAHSQLYLLYSCCVPGAAAIVPHDEGSSVSL